MRASTFWLESILIIIIIIIFTLTNGSHGSKILFFIGLGTPSHRVAMQPLATKLADIGHEVTFLSSIEPQELNPKIREVRLESAFKTFADHNSGVMAHSLKQRINNKYYEYLFEGTHLWDLFCIQYEAFLYNREFLEFVRESHYDLIITDYNVKEVAHAIGHVMGSKMIWFSTAGAQFHLDFELLGLPIESSWLPDLTLGSPYSFIPDHFIYACNSLSWYFSFYSYFLPKVNKIVWNSLGEGVPSMDEMYANVDLVFLNEHFSYAYPRSLPPFVVPIGGMHCKDTNSSLIQMKSASAQKILGFISKTKFQGFIYVSLGSFIDTSKIPRMLSDALFETFALFENTAFLVKWGQDVPESLPSNTLIMSWFPQQEILAHQKCKGFVTQGGAMSFQQAVHNEVPVIVIPAWWDQSNIGRRSAELGIGVHLEMPAVAKESLKTAINDILRNESYAQNMKLVSARSKDRPMEAKNLAVWWTDQARVYTPQLVPFQTMSTLWKHRFLIFILPLLACIPLSANAARILFFLGIGSQSHRVAMQPLATKLAEIGHEVTFLSHIKPSVPNPNITEFFPESASKILSSTVSDISVDAIQGRLKQKYYDPFQTPEIVWEYSMKGQEATVLNPEFQTWLRETDFDLIIYDSPLREMALGIGYKKKAKVIAFVTMAVHPPGDFDFLGLPVESSWLPDYSMGSQYSFIPHHFVNTYSTLSWYLSYKWYYIPRMDSALKTLFQEDLPSIDDLIRKIDLVFVNEHFSSSFPRSLPPFVVPIGGLHCKESKGILPLDMETFLKTKDRFVYISFGSAIKVSALPVETQKMLFNTVEAIDDTNFLWKWEGDIPKNLPKNVFAMNWFPQQDVLAHPKCKGFMTQGGVMSFQQASYHGVPIIVVPIWSDQNYVAHSAVYQGTGLHLELSEITGETLTTAIRQILDVKSYLQNAKAVSRRFKDRPMSPIDTAIWWTDLLNNQSSFAFISSLHKISPFHECYFKDYSTC
ncbi:unnamed protein product [Allacma fusca]|uniref:UDP-glycosyltransferase n=1 Tax=Allacma fusca TaxID=39272 RepID=A0A8J2KD81_9HEXA|nr:unnamed protein product [Allacma fusca]